MNHPVSVGAAANRMGGGRKHAGACKSRLSFSMSDLREAHLSLRVLSEPLCSLAWRCSIKSCHTSFCYGLPGCQCGLSAPLAWKALFSVLKLSTLFSEGSGHSQLPLRTSAAHPTSPHPPQTRSNPPTLCSLTHVLHPTMGEKVTINRMTLYPL